MAMIVCRTVPALTEAEIKDIQSYPQQTVVPVGTRKIKVVKPGQSRVIESHKSETVRDSDVVLIRQRWTDALESAKSQSHSAAYAALFGGGK